MSNSQKVAILHIPITGVRFIGHPVANGAQNGFGQLQFLTTVASMATRNIYGAAIF